MEFSIELDLTFFLRSGLINEENVTVWEGINCLNAKAMRRNVENTET